MSRPVEAAWEHWSRLLADDPARFDRESRAALEELRSRLAERVGARPEQIGLAPSTRGAIHEVARSLPLRPGDVVLAGTEEHHAVATAWKTLCLRREAQFRQVPAAGLSAHLQYRPAVLFFSQVACETGRLLPADELCRQARQLGVLSLVDGAHGFGQVPPPREADFYASCLHKWMGAPYGAAFLVARERALPPWEPSFPERLPFLAALRALEEARPPDPALAAEARERIERLTGLPGLPPWGGGMVCCRLPSGLSRARLNPVLEALGLHCVLARVEGELWLRAILDARSSRPDVDRLVAAVASLLPPPVDLSALLTSPEGKTFRPEPRAPRRLEKGTAQTFFRHTGRLPAQLRGKLVLEAGCGSRSFAALLAQAGARVVVLDPWAGNLEEGRRQGLCCLQADLDDAPLLPASFDYVYSPGGLQQVRDPRRAFTRLTRLLRPGAEMAIWVQPPSGPLGFLLRLFPLLRPWMLRLARLAARLPNRDLTHAERMERFWERYGHPRPLRRERVESWFREEGWEVRDRGRGWAVIGGRPGEGLPSAERNLRE